MQVSPPRLIPSPMDIFRECIPQDFCHELTRLIVHDYQKAYILCEGQFAPQEAHDARPHVRRAYIEQDVRNAAQRFTEIASSVPPNSANNCYHTEIRAGRVVLTISAVDKPETIIREARFRFAYANEWQSAMPFMEQDDFEPASERSVYAVAIHGPNPQDGKLPGFIHVVFPTPDCSAYLAGRIDLLREHPDILGEFGGPEVIVPPTIYLREGALPSEAGQDA